MPQVIGLVFLVLLVTGCGSGTDSGRVFSSEEGHTGGWTDPAFFRKDGFHGSSVAITSGSLDGALLFARRCSGCHGRDASGKIGPNIRGQSADVIRGATGFVIYMRWLEALRDDEREAIAAFLANPEAVSGEPPFVPVQAGVCTQCHGGDFRGGIAGVTCFGCHDGPDGSVGHPPSWLSDRGSSVLFHGRYGRDFVAACATCHGPDLKGPKVPSCFVCHDGVNAPLLRAVTNLEGGWLNRSW